MKVSIQRVKLPDHRRILMISDLHGHADGLRAILKKARFTPDDVLIIVGDLIEKGPQSLDTLRLVMGLMKTHTVYPLMGNVDLARLELLTSDDPKDWQSNVESSLRAVGWWGSSLLKEMCAELGEELTPNINVTHLMRMIQRHFQPEIDFIASLPTILDTQRITFVHGGLPHEALSELEGSDAHPLLKFDSFYTAGLSFSKYVAVGHWPAVLYSSTYPDFRPIIDRERHILCLDGGCGVKREGQLNLLMLPSWDSEDFSLLSWDSLPTITALEDQSPSPADRAHYIRWSDRWVTVLKRGEEMSDVLYHGETVSVPTQYLGEQNGRSYCADSTDYVLPVRAGDQMSLILKLSHGCLVKKDNMGGWYFGPYQTNAEEKEE